MLNNKVEHCPNCGKIKSKFKACKHCGWDYGLKDTMKDMSPMPATDVFAPKTFKYFASYSSKKSDSENDILTLGNMVFFSGIEAISSALILEVENLLKDKYGEADFIILNIIKLEY